MKVLMQHPHREGEISGVLTYIQQATAALDPFDVTVREFSTHRVSWLEVWQAVKTTDIVHLNSNHLPLLLAARLLGRPILIKYHYPFWWENVARTYRPQGLLSRLWSDARFHWAEYRETPSFLKRGAAVSRAIIRSALRLVVALLVDHRTACSRYLAETNDLPCSTEVDYNPIDFSSGTDSPASSESTEPPVILYVGRVDRTKGVDILLQAAALLALDGHSFQVELIGDGDHLDELRAETIHLGLSKRVQIQGRRSRIEVQEAMSRAAAIVVPSRWNDPAPYVILEALVANRICFASKMGGIPELLGESEFLFENGDASGLAQRLSWLLGNPTQAQAHLATAREAARAKCDWPVAGARLKAIYQRLLSPRKITNKESLAVVA